MSDTFDHSGMPEDERLAAEYALGVLDGAERAAAAQRMAREPVFAALVARWEAHFAPWADEIDEVRPPPHVWERIASAVPAPMPAPPRPNLWQSLTLWRGLTVATAALAAACIAALIYVGSAVRQQPLVASIDGGGHRHFVATVDPGRDRIAVAPAAFSADATRVPELWLIPPDGRPRPVGLLSADRTVTLTLPAPLAALAKDDAVLAVSLEPPGGSPTGAPTGPVIASGKLTNL
jgi:anti-sigma-K factor RskA